MRCVRTLLYLHCTLLTRLFMQDKPGIEAEVMVGIKAESELVTKASHCNPSHPDPDFP